ncbi:hypothetical protein OC834_002699 [Tilletia horrida]|nr:hypothetical protein OC834_002699 [Tilletia horrida]KAK0534459.1 hypothetical protein OC835_002667 [Tilletia horrida]
MSSDSAASAVQKKAQSASTGGGQPSPEPIRAVAESWEDEDDDGVGLTNNDGGDLAARGLQHDSGSSWTSTPESGVDLHQEATGATVEDWTRANATAPRMLLARRTGDVKVDSNVVDLHFSSSGSRGTGTASMQHIMLSSNTPRILQRPANLSGQDRSGASGASSPASAVSAEERARMLKEKEERYRLARERIFGPAESSRGKSG